MLQYCHIVIELYCEWFHSDVFAIYRLRVDDDDDVGLVILLLWSGKFTDENGEKLATE